MASEILFTRHGAAVQERRTQDQIDKLEKLPDEEFQAEIRAMNMRQGLTEQGRLQAKSLGRRIGKILLPEAETIVALIGPYRRHQETATIALTMWELAERNIQVIYDDRLAERSRGRLDASIWPAYRLRGLPSDHPYAQQFITRGQHPATWRPPQGENYPDVNARVDAALEEHGIAKTPHPVVVFGSAEMSLASLKLSDEAYRQGTVTRDGRPMSLLTLNNAGIVALRGMNEANEFTHWQVYNPVNRPLDASHQNPDVIRSQLNQY